jgi:hypothetical protein
VLCLVCFVFCHKSTARLNIVNCYIFIKVSGSVCSYEWLSTAVKYSDTFLNSEQYRFCSHGALFRAVLCCFLAANTRPIWKLLQMERGDFICRQIFSVLKEHSTFLVVICYFLYYTKHYSGPLISAVNWSLKVQWIRKWWIQSGWYTYVL